MALSSDLLSQFAKVTNDTRASNDTTSTVVYGETVIYNGKTYVKIDGSDLLTPVNTTASVSDGDRVSVSIENHTATVTGNLSDPSASSVTVEKQGSQISEFEIIIADKVSTKDLEAESARIDTLVAENVTITNDLSVTKANIEKLEAEDATIKGKLEAANADITKLTTEKLDAEIADVTYANIDFSNIGMAAVEELFAKSGIINNIIVGDQNITGELVGVTIKGDLIEGETIVAEKLVIKGEDGLYYKLNMNGETIEGEQTDYNSINGSIITAKSITASKIAVEDLVAFGATIGGLKLTDGSLYSGVKESVDNTTQGFYIDKEGQLSLGDASNFLKCYKDEDGNYRLDISASSIEFSNGTTGLADLLNRIAIDTETGSLAFTSSNSVISLSIENDMIAFKKNGEQFGWWDGEDFHTGNIIVDVNERAQFGNFAFIPRRDGSLMFLKVGDSIELHIITQPVGVTTQPYATVTYTIEAAGNGLTYTWQHSDDNGVTWTDVKYTTCTADGYDTDTLNIYAEYRDGGAYSQMVRCIVTDMFGDTVTSDAAELFISYYGGT